MVWDRIRTGEYYPWTCTLCGRDYSGLQTLSVLGIVDDPREAPRPNKPAAMAVVCGSCDSVSTEETQRRIEQMFGLIGTNAPLLVGDNEAVSIILDFAPLHEAEIHFAAKCLGDPIQQLAEPHRFS
jgi:hypothetical protein